MPKDFTIFSDVIDVGVDLADEDYEFLRKATMGDEQRVLKAFVLSGIVEMDKIGKMRKIRSRSVLYEKGDPIQKAYDDLDGRVGKKTRIAINLRNMLELIIDFKGDVNAFCREKERKFETWRANNGHKYEF